MDFWLENKAPILVAGAMFATMAGIVYSSLRTRVSLLALMATVLLTVGGLILEHVWQTPREQVRASLQQLFAAVEADDLPAVLARLTPASSVRSDAELLMPRFTIEKLRTTGSVDVTLGAGQPPRSATVNVRAFLQATQKRGGLGGGAFSDIELQFERHDDQWLLGGYSVSEEWRRKASALGRGR